MTRLSIEQVPPGQRPRGTGSRLEEQFLADLTRAAPRVIPSMVREHRFDPVRRWRFDFAWPDWKVALEVEGGTWAGGQHTRGVGFADDAEKYNTAAIAGWRVIRVDSKMVKDGRAVNFVRLAIAAAFRERASARSGPDA